MRARTQAPQRAADCLSQGVGQGPTPRSEPKASEGKVMQIDRLPLISADSHVQEPPRFFVDRLPAALHAALPQEMLPEADSAAEFGKRIGAHDRSTARMEQISAGRTNDPEGRFAVMREDGVAGECIFPTRSLYVWNMTDADAGRACCETYNDWIHE